MENDIKPVAWMTHHDQPMLFDDYAVAESYCDDYEEPLSLYLQSAIDRLTADAVGYKRIADEAAGMLESAEGLIDRLTAERDALAAQLAEYREDAERWRFFNGSHDLGDGERADLHINIGVNIWRGDEWVGFDECSPDVVKAVIDASRKWVDDNS